MTKSTFVHTVRSPKINTAGIFVSSNSPKFQVSFLPDRIIIVVGICINIGFRSVGILLHWQTLKSHAKLIFAGIRGTLVLVNLLIGR